MTADERGRVKLALGVIEGSRDFDEIASAAAVVREAIEADAEREGETAPTLADLAVRVARLESRPASS